MRAVVVGAGPGGLAAALGLARRGHDVTVLEAATGPRLEGSAVTLWPNGTAVLQALDVLLDGLGAQVTSLDGCTSHGRHLLRVDMTALAEDYGGAPALSVPRRELVQRLASLLPAETITYGARCLRAREAGSTVEVHLESGAVLPADLVVGADGHGSALRTQLWGRPGTRPTGWVTWQGMSRVPDAVAWTGDRVCGYYGPEGFVGVQPAGKDLLMWHFSVPRGSRFSDGDVVSMLHDRFGSWPSPVPDVLRLVTNDALESWPHHTHDIPDVWGSGRTTLVGDAAHTMPPSLAQGVNQALEDVWALLQSLATVPPGADPAAALRSYESVRAAQVRPLARLAATELALTYRRSASAAMQVLPERTATEVYRRVLGRSSAVVAARA